jgi:hypothetical protein
MKIKFDTYDGEDTLFFYDVADADCKAELGGIAKRGWGYHKSVEALLWLNGAWSTSISLGRFKTTREAQQAVRKLYADQSAMEQLLEGHFKAWAQKTGVDFSLGRLFLHPSVNPFKEKK